MLQVAINAGCGTFIEVAVYAAPTAFSCTIFTQASNFACVIAHGQPFARHAQRHRRRPGRHRDRPDRQRELRRPGHDRPDAAQLRGGRARDADRALRQRRSRRARTASTTTATAWPTPATPPARPIPTPAAPAPRTRRRTPRSASPRAARSSSPIFNERRAVPRHRGRRLRRDQGRVVQAVGGAGRTATTRSARPPRRRARSRARRREPRSPRRRQEVLLAHAHHHDSAVRARDGGDHARRRKGGVRRATTGVDAACRLARCGPRRPWTRWSSCPPGGMSWASPARSARVSWTRC